MPLFSIQNQGGFGSASTPNPLVSSNFNSNSGNLLVCAVRAGNSTTVSSVKNAAGVAFTSCGNTQTSGAQKTYMFYMKNIVGAAADNISITFSAGQSNNCAYFWEVNGADPYAPLDQATGGSSLGTITSASFTTTSANEIILAMAADNSATTFVNQAGYTLDSGNGFGGFIGAEHLVVSSIQTGVTTSMTGGLGSAQSIVVGTFIATTATNYNVQRAQSYFANSVAANTQSLAFGANVVSGNLLVVVSSSDAGTGVNTPTDTLSTVYHQIGSTQHTGAHLTGVFYGVATSSGANTVTCTWPADAGNKFQQISLAEYATTVAGATLTLDQSHQATGTSALPNTGAITPAHTHELVVAVADDDGTTWTATGPCALRTAGASVRAVIADIPDAIVPQYLQSADSGFHSAESSQSQAFTNPNTLGNLLIAEHYTSSIATPPTISDTLSNTGWVKVGTVSSGAEFCTLFYCPSCKAGANTVTVTQSPSFTVQRLTVAEYWQADSIDPGGSAGPSSNSAGSGTPVTASITTSKAPSIVVAALESNASATTAASPFTSRVQDFGGIADDIVLSTQTGLSCTFAAGSGGGAWANWIANFYQNGAQTVYGSWSIASASWNATIASFYPATTTNTNQLMMTGAGT